MEQKNRKVNIIIGMKGLVVEYNIDCKKHWHVLTI